MFLCCKRRHCIMPFVKNHLRKEAAPPPAPSICRLRLLRKSEITRAIMLRFAPQRGERVRYAVRREAAHERSRSTAPAGLRRMRELRNCHFSGNLCPTRGESLACKRISTKWRTSAAREVPRRHITLVPPRQPNAEPQAHPRVVSQNHDIFAPQHSQKRFRRKIFCEEERRAF